MQSYLSEGKQRTKINQAQSSWKEILFGVAQGSILTPILFDIFLVISSADDYIIYDGGDNVDEVIFSLQQSSKKLFKWLADNQMKTDKDKCHLFNCKHK